MTICTLQKLGLQKLLLYICVVHYLENVYKLVKILLKFIAAPYIHSSILHLKHGGQFYRIFTINQAIEARALYRFG